MQRKRDAVAKIRVLLLTGANNHDWQRSAPFCKGLLEQSGKFRVTLTETPSAVLEHSAIRDDYDLLFMDYNGPQWTETAKANFEAAVAEGVGLVILHAADNAFAGWIEFEKMVGLLWRGGTGHGQFHEFDARIMDHNHPITCGLSDFRLWDELYHRLVHMHNVPYEVLATAYSDPATGGTGKDEPVMVTTRYGQGRVYHHVLGHVWPGDNPEQKGSTMITFENKSFQQALIRGCEWAATGQVSENQTKEES